MSRLLLTLLFFCCSSFAAQYQSRELAPPSAQEIQAGALSIDELEAQLDSNNNDYQKASTARFLARHYLQEKAYAKSILYYKKSLESDGLSRYAKQDILAELAQAYYLHKQYQPSINSFKQRLELGGKEEAHHLLIEALAHYFLAQTAEALSAADKAQQLQARPTAEFLQQLLMIYYNQGAFTKALNVQKSYLQLKPWDANGWKQLSTIYLQKKDYQNAASSLSLALQNQLELTEQDIMQLAELYAVTKNPYAGARLISTHIKRANFQQLEKQYRYWLMAKEYQLAIKSLQQMLAIKPSTEDYLELAKLNQLMQDWSAMQNAVLSACKLHLPDELAGEANVLLGISELEQGHYEQAQIAFTNATFIGGVIEEANAWLDYMQAENIDAELDDFKGPCAPSWARFSPKQVVVASKNSATSDAAPAIDYQIKTTAEQTLAIADYTLPIKELERKIKPLAIKLGMNIAQNKGKIDGGLLFIFSEPANANAEIIHFQMAFPVSKVPEVRGQRFRIEQDSGYYAASLIVETKPKDLIDYWATFYQQVVADGHELAMNARQNILAAEGEKIKVELLIGLKKKN